MIFGNGYRFALLWWKLKTYNLRVWRNGRRTSLRSWRATVQVRVLSPALNQGFITVNWQFCHLPQQAV